MKVVFDRMEELPEEVVKEEQEKRKQKIAELRAKAKAPESRSRLN